MTLKLIYFLWVGLDRNLRIIGFGNLPSAYKDADVNDVFLEVDKSKFKRLALLVLLFRYLFSKHYYTYKSSRSPVIFAGSSSNNIREFNFFASLNLDTRLAVSYSSEANLSLLRSVKVRRNFIDYTISLLVYLIVAVYQFKVRLNPLSIKYLVTFANVYLQLYYDIRRRYKSIQLGVVANDHTDFSVAFFMLCRVYNIPTMYIQHAQVNPNFPPLCFDMSVLHNERSKFIYSQAGAIEGEVVVLPRRKVHFSKIKASVSKIVCNKTNSVVIYLSSIYSLVNLRMLIESLMKNSYVNSIAIKIHPRSRESEFSGFDCKVYTELPDFDHVAIVGNSSVVVELLERGIPVFQYFDLDCIGRDYYAFLSSRVVYEFCIERSADQFWLNYDFDDDWLMRLEAFLPGEKAFSEGIEKLTSFINRVSRK